MTTDRRIARLVSFTGEGPLGQPHGLFVCGGRSAAYFIPPPSIASIANSIASSAVRRMAEL
jgi:hypothetical protein